MDYQLPNINEITTINAISWYTKELTKIFDIKNRVNGTYTDEYKDALLVWKQELNSKALNERSNLRRDSDSLG
ncbi:hypothetical protein [Oceanobacillus picturae]|uniref:hypothetical protein n=1 Tax=Oceanobacillus picturae TaxID=171693 RepID=UPI000E690F0A|nr:hypothetical protein [Oceanobacillus picturae]RIU93316.1 hypothetical protein D1864_07545 [Oceanobacillus picturae]